MTPLSCATRLPSEQRFGDPRPSPALRALDQPDNGEEDDRAYDGYYD